MGKALYTAADLEPRVISLVIQLNELKQILQDQVKREGLLQARIKSLEERISFLYEQASSAEQGS